MRQNMLQVSTYFVTLLIILGLVGCDLGDRSPTTPGSPVTGEQAANFWASPATGDTFGIALGPGAFRVRTLPGDYLLTYTTQLGTFYIPFRALQTTKLTIGLPSGDTVIEVTLQSGTITDISQGIAFEDDTIIALSWPGSNTVVNWQEVFNININLSVVVLVQGGQVVESELVEDLSDESITYGVYLGKGILQLYVPRGDYLVEYTTMQGTFHVVFRTSWARFVSIFLPGDDTILDVSIQQGVIPVGVEPLDEQGSVLFYFWPGASPLLVWSHVFIVNVNLRPVILVQGGKIVINNPLIIILPGINELPEGFDPGGAGEFGGDCENLNIPPGALPPPGACKIWDPALPPGQQGPPVACSCFNVIPGTCLIDHFGNVISCN